MKITGIIAEYNPFHNGHKYLIERAKENSDALVIAMSQEVVQRGEFSPFDKSFRAETALENGADLVVGLPTLTSLSSAASFAEGGIKLLSALNIGRLAYGIEGYEREEFEKIIEVLNNEPKSFKKFLQNELRSGSTFPRARMLALEQYLNKDLGSYFKKANNILALEYRRVLSNTSIKPFEIKRVGSGYHELGTENFYSSASGIRDELIKEGKLNSKVIPYSVERLENSYSIFDEEAFFKTLLVKLISAGDDELLLIPGFNRDFVNRIRKAQKENFKSLEDFITFLKTKNLTRTRIQRGLMAFLLGINNKDIKRFEYSEPYIRVLAANKTGREILKKTTVRLVFALKA